MAVLAGGLGGAVAILFRGGIDLFQALFYGTASERLAHLAADLSPWHRLFAPALGGLVVGLLVHSLLPDRRPHGVADVIEAAALRGGRIPFRTGLAAGLVNALSLGAGASLGREGPAVHLAASASSWLAHAVRLPTALTRTLLACGVAAGVAASFNAPLAGVIFAMEVTLGEAVLAALAPVVLAAVVGTVMVRLSFGDQPAFALPPLPAPPIAEYPLFIAAGVLAGLLAALFIRLMVAAPAVCRRAGVATGIPRWLHPALGGLAVGAIAVRWPEVLGVGYEATDTALKGGYALAALGGLLAVKLAAAVISFGAGLGGGVFSPSLMLGAVAGSAFGLFVGTALPGTPSGETLYAMVGMGAVAAAVLGAPFSTVLIIFEMTANYPATVAAMLGVTASSMVARAAAGPSFFHMQLARAGVDLRDGTEVGLLASARVRDLMLTDPPRVTAGADAQSAAAALAGAPGGVALLVADPGGRPLGILTAAGPAGPLPALTPADDLRAALARFDETGAAALPVVDPRSEPPRAIGLLLERDALRTYRRLVGGRRP